jgi:hypothetical protein
VRARVRPENMPSRRLFESTGFVQTEAHSDHLVFERCAVRRQE